MSVGGRVKCIGDSCSLPVRVVLTSPSRPDFRASATVDSATSRFVFNDVNPGTYKLTAQQDAWCWDQGTVEANVSCSLQSFGLSP